MEQDILETGHFGDLPSELRACVVLFFEAFLCLYLDSLSKRASKNQNLMKHGHHFSAQTCQSIITSYTSKRASGFCVCFWPILASDPAETVQTLQLTPTLPSRAGGPGT